MFCIIILKQVYGPNKNFHRTIFFFSDYTKRATCSNENSIKVWIIPHLSINSTLGKSKISNKNVHKIDLKTLQLNKVSRIYIKSNKTKTAKIKAKKMSVIIVWWLIGLFSCAVCKVFPFFDLTWQEAYYRWSSYKNLGECRVLAECGTVIISSSALANQSFTLNNLLEQ